MMRSWAWRWVPSVQNFLVRHVSHACHLSGQCACVTVHLTIRLDGVRVELCAMWCTLCETPLLNLCLQISSLAQAHESVTLLFMGEWAGTGTTSMACTHQRQGPGVLQQVLFLLFIKAQRQRFQQRAAAVSTDVGPPISAAASSCLLRCTLCADVVGFTNMSKEVPPKAVSLTVSQSVKNDSNSSGVQEP